MTQNYNELLLLQRKLAHKNLQLAAANAELRGLTEMKSVFVSVAAHELRNPLAVIQGYADMLLGDRAEDLTARQRDGLEIVKRSSLHLLEITNNLLDLARIELGRVDLLLQPLELERLIWAVVREFQPRLDAAGQQVEVRVDPGLPLALCDETRAGQILRNIVSNAHKYTPPMGRSASTSDGPTGLTSCWSRFPTRGLGFRRKISRNCLVAFFVHAMQLRRGPRAPGWACTSLGCWSSCTADASGSRVGFSRARYFTSPFRRRGLAGG